MSEHHPLDVERITAVIQPLFSSRIASIEPASGGTYTSVYRIVCSDQIFYLRLLPEAQEHFATEAAVHSQLRRLQVKVPEVIHFERYNEVLQQSFMITTEIKGLPLSQSDTLSQGELHTILREAGHDLARINSLPVRGFGWMHELEATDPLSAPFSTHRAFALHNWDKHLNTLASTILSAPSVIMLEQVLRRYDSWLDI
ncbi:MAG TPA: phosphotransferase, partial [Ktedonobacteraceae bacterium]